MKCMANLSREGVDFFHSFIESESSYPLKQQETSKSNKNATEVEEI